MRRPDSHKGDNGVVAVIGGCATMHGAPIFAALAAEASGVDLVHLSVPARHETVARTFSLNVQVHPFRGDAIAEADIEAILELLASVDCAVIGPGLSREPKHLRTLERLIGAVSCPVVLDASALQTWTLAAIEGKHAIITPHLGELERMGVAPGDIGRVAAAHRVTIHCKGSVDRIANEDGEIRSIDGGNAGLTVGGTGDALAGLIAGLRAQGMAPLDACAAASECIKGAAEALEGEFGFAFGTMRVIGEIPRILRKRKIMA